MNQDLKFPVKYAVLELKSIGGYTTDYEYITEGFIVSKCYVVGSEIRYFPTGEANATFKVFFPYDDVDNFQRMIFMGLPYYEERKQLGIDACSNYSPVHIVDELFDTYEEAKEEAKHKNKIMKRRIVLNFSSSDSNFKEKYDEAVGEFKKRLFNFSFYEQYITENTKDMEVTQDERLDTLRRLRKKTE